MQKRQYTVDKKGITFLGEKVAMLLFSFLHVGIEGLRERIGTELRALGCLKEYFGCT